MSYSELDKPVRFVKGVGPKRAGVLGHMGIATARDLLYHVPRRYDDASTTEPIDSLKVGMDASAVGRVRSKGVLPTRSGLRIFQAVLQDESGMITCAWPGQPWLDRKIREGDRLLVTGPVRFFHGRQLQPREFTVLGREGRSDDGDGDEDGDEDAGAIFVVYPASEEMPQWVLRRIFRKNLEWMIEEVEAEEYLPEEARDALRLPALPEALRALHSPRSMDEVEAGRRRLAYDELFFLQLAQARVRWEETEAHPGIVHRRTNRLIKPLHEGLPFQLTDAQARVLREIYADLTSERRMSRLLQGDVGSGKTVVALFAMLLAVEGGWQAALMAPTEILAEQHHRQLSDFLEPLEVDVRLLTGRMPEAERRPVLEALASGEAPLVVGTHALIQETVTFERLGLAVVDEQHRFGVRQRMALGERESRPDVLVMSATPIPRSLALTLYGDLDLSVLDELPPGRKPVKTVLRGPGRRDEVFEFVEGELEKGGQAYVVYPLVDASDKVDLRSASQEHERLAEEVFAHRRVGLLHGRLDADAKDDVMRRFRNRDLDVVVATSVIEVGIDVPSATVMVVEHAERFGLSQLHQLRGRVGRAGEQSYCILISEADGDAAERLKVFRDTADGFAVARADLQIRGQGDLFGDRQHGRDPILRHADLTRHEQLLVEARRRARGLVADDPRLESAENERLRALLEERYADRLELYRVG